MLILSKARDVQGYPLFQLFFPFTQVNQHVKGVPAIYVSSVEFHDLKPSGDKASGLVIFQSFSVQHYKLLLYDSVRCRRSLYVRQ